MAHAVFLALDHSYTHHTQTVRAGQDFDPEDHLFQWHTLYFWHWIIPIQITHRQSEQGRILILRTICSSGTRWISGIVHIIHRQSEGRILILRTICSSGTRWISGTGSFLYTSQTVRAGQDLDPEDHLFQWHTLDLWHWIIPIHSTDSQSRAGS